MVSVFYMVLCTRQVILQLWQKIWLPVTCMFLDLSLDQCP